MATCSGLLAITRTARNFSSLMYRSRFGSASRCIHLHGFSDASPHCMAFVNTCDSRAFSRLPRTGGRLSRYSHTRAVSSPGRAACDRMPCAGISFPSGCRSVSWAPFSESRRAGICPLSDQAFSGCHQLLSRHISAWLQGNQYQAGAGHYYCPRSRELKGSVTNRNHYQLSPTPLVPDDDEIVINDTQGSEVFSARLSDLVPNISTSVHMRQNICARRLVSDAINRLVTMAKKSLGNKGYV